MTPALALAGLVAPSAGNGRVRTAAREQIWTALDWVIQRIDTGTLRRNADQIKAENDNMNNQFDELTKGMAQSVTRRGALKNPVSASLAWRWPASGWRTRHKQYPNGVIP